MMTRKTRKQIPDLLPLLLVMLNRIRTSQIVPELSNVSSHEKLEKVIRLFRWLIDNEKDPVMKRARIWSLSYFESCARGIPERREFLIGEGIYDQGTYLKCPDNVRPKMEICNFDQETYPAEKIAEIREQMVFMFTEYLGVKNLLSFPDWTDILTTFSPGFFWKKYNLLPAPRLKVSLLLSNYSQTILKETELYSGKPLISILGPGKGEETVPLVMKGYSVICLDINNIEILAELFLDTFRDFGIKPPKIIYLNEGQNINEHLDTWEKNRYPPTIFLCSKVDFSKPDAIPDSLKGLSRVSASIYVMHEIEEKENMLKNMAALSHGSIVIYDGVPSVAAMDNVILPVSDYCEAFITGHDAVISHLLSLTPEDALRTAMKVMSDYVWEKRMVGPLLPGRLLHQLQYELVGRPATL